MKRFHSPVGVLTAIAIGMAQFASAAPDDATKCLAAKIKIVGKYEACRYKAESLAVLKELAPDNSKCDTKFADSWQKTETKYGLDCPTSGDATSIKDETSAHVDEIVTTLKNAAPVCGNNTIEGDEVCDGTALAGETCESLGFDSGTLACAGACEGFDTSGCFVEECDLLDQTGCMAGEACYPLGLNKVCAGEGTSTEDQACMFANSCVAGQACVDGFCAPFCDSVDNVPGCGGGQTCVNDPQWGANVGYCEDM